MKKLKTYYNDQIDFRRIEIKYYLILMLSLGFLGCQKDFLSKKPDKALIVPTTLTDCQSLLDNSTLIINVIPSLSEIATDDYYTTDAGLQRVANILPYEKNTYLFAKELEDENTNADWDTPYQQIFYANVVLDALSNLKVGASSAQQYNQVKGSALFIRAFAFFNLAQEFAGPYIAATASTDLGIQLRLSSDVLQKSVRSTLQQTYEQVLNDLNQAQKLLPAQASIKTRPTNLAALALLARVYLSMNIYDKAGEFANACLQINSKLIDYNTLNATNSRPLPISLPNGNDEVLFYTSLIARAFNTSSLTSVDSTLYRSYDNNDLRKTMFYRDRGNGIFTFKGSYSGDLPLFAGLATDEIYLTRAECYARNGSTSAAMNDLNTLLNKRWKTGTFVQLTAPNAKDALLKILAERRKELIGRGLRWTDLRRLNQDPEFAVTITHVNRGQIYTLLPNDKRYVFPIPQNEIAKSGIQQNPR